MPAAAPPSAPRDVFVGVALMCGALASFTLLDAAAKWAMRHGVPALETVWLRYVGATALILVTAAPSQWRAMIRSNRPWMQALRSAFLFGSTLLNFLALQTLQLAETIAILFSMPLIVALAAGPLLGEWVGPRRLIAIVIGFAGVLVVTQPGGAGFKPAMLYSVAGAFCYAAYILMTRALARADAPRTALLHSNLVGLFALAPAMPAVWAWPASAGVGVALFVVAAFGALGHLMIILAHRRAPAGTLAPFVYAQLLFMIVAGWVMFGDRPGPATLLGAGIVVASGLYLLARERAAKGEGEERT
jgi:drug/metabolite transporter (DMT)-like permease